jgi:spermidine synthase
MREKPKDKIISRSSSQFNQTIEVALENGILVLNSENGNYSYGNLHVVFDEVFRAENIGQKQYNHILLLGMGAGSVIDLLKNNYNQKQQFTAVEIDAEIIQVSRQYFNLDGYNNCSVINQDAFDFVFETKDIYDLIIVDIYIDLDIPSQFESEEFISQLFHICDTNGIIMFNKVVQSSKQMRQFSKLAALFDARAHTYHYTLLDFNKILVSKLI